MTRRRPVPTLDRPPTAPPDALVPRLFWHEPIFASVVRDLGLPEFMSEADVALTVRRPQEAGQPA